MRDELKYLIARIFKNKRKRLKSFVKQFIGSRHYARRYKISEFRNIIADLNKNPFSV